MRHQPGLASLGRGFWLSRGIALALFVVLGAFLSRGRPANGFYYTDGHELASALVAGLGIALLALLTVGTLSYGLKRWQSIHTSWSDAAFGVPVIVVTLIVLFVSSGFRFALHSSSVIGARADTRGTSAERERARLNALAFHEDLKPAFQLQRAAVRDLRAWGSLTALNSSRARILVSSARRHLSDGLSAARGVSDYHASDLREIRSAVIELIAHQRQAVDIYLAALEGNRMRGTPLMRDAQSVKLLQRADDLMARADADVDRLRNLDAQLTARYGFG